MEQTLGGGASGPLAGINGEGEGTTPVTTALVQKIDEGKQSLLRVELESKK